MGYTAVARVLCLLALALAACGKIHHVTLTRDDRRLVLLTEAFGFADGGQGRIELSIKDVAVWTKHDDQTKPNWDNFGFFLSPVEADPVLEAELLNTDKCILADLQKEAIMLTFKDSAIQKLVAKKVVPSTPFHFEVQSGGMYSLYFANCEPDMAVTLDSTIQLYNLVHDKKDYLSIGETELEIVYWVMFGLFTVVCGVWVWYVWVNRAESHRIHYLMGVLCAFKALTLMCQAGAYHFVERTGSADGWNIAYYVFTFFRGVLFFTVVVLIGTGWSYMKPFLGDKEKRILLVVIPLQVFANIAIIVTDETSPAEREWFTWRDLFHLVDIICCCVILFPIVWSIKHLREASHTDGKAARNLEKLTLFRQFYVMVVVYIYFTRIVVSLLRSTMDYEYAWVSHAAEHFATLAFYMWTAVRFRPQANNPYLKLETSEIEL